MLLRMHELQNCVADRLTSPATQNGFIVACKINNERFGSYAPQINIDYVNVGHGSAATHTGGCLYRTWLPKSAGLFQRAGLGKVDIIVPGRAVSIHAPHIAVAWRRRHIGTPGRHPGAARLTDAPRRISNYLRNGDRGSNSVAEILCAGRDGVGDDVLS